MVLLFIILVVVACIVLSLVVLVQNPKGGGLAGNIGGFSNQFMGVKQTTDVLEKGTWIFAAVIAILCITSTLFIPGGKQLRRSVEPGAPGQQQQQQQQTAPQPGANTTTLPGATK
ncbi:MAG TPA: preprotein translocase subunit SecG [Flavisolibacter sp.]|nr:preprotein translocase subunit SecG [Flavisolibacter sp.]